jgi:hypothetical protein
VARQEHIRPPNRAARSSKSRICQCLRYYSRIGKQSAAINAPTCIPSISLRSISHPDQRYIGISEDLTARLDGHNRGQSPHTADFNRGKSLPQSPSPTNNHKAMLHYTPQTTQQRLCEKTMLPREKQENVTQLPCRLIAET